MSPARRLVDRILHLLEYAVDSRRVFYSEYEIVVPFDGGDVVFDRLGIEPVLDDFFETLVIWQLLKLGKVQPGVFTRRLLSLLWLLDLAAQVPDRILQTICGIFYGVLAGVLPDAQHPVEQPLAALIPEIACHGVRPPIYLSLM